MLLGFDIGGTKCAVVLGEQDGAKMKVVAKKIVSTNKPPFEMIETLFSLAETLLIDKKLSVESIDGIGISCGGPLNSKDGIIVAPPNLIGWQNIAIVAMAEERFRINTMLLNDANACAMAEWKYGAGRGLMNVIFLTFGTGMGAGLILNGHLYSGTTDLAGEVGHLRLAEMGPVGFGKAGSFEGFCSGGGLAQLAQIKVIEKIQAEEKVSFCDTIEQSRLLTAKHVAEAALAGDKLAQEIYAICGFYLGRGISFLIDILNPQMVILGSIYSRSEALLRTAMMGVIEKEALAASRNACRIVPAALGESIGDVAALVLAAAAAEQLQEV